MSKYWNDLKRELFPAICAFCKREPAVHLHHAVYGRMKSKPELDVRFNALPFCAECHKYADGWDARVRAWGILCERYGEDVMREWHESLPLKAKENFG